MTTLENIEDEIDPSKQNGVKAKIAARLKANFLMNAIRRLKKQEDLLKEIPDIDGKKIIKALVTGNKHLSAEEFDVVSKKFGTRGITMLEGMEHLNKAQKQWIFKQMGWDINEVE
jgi:hypothetical protein